MQLRVLGVGTPVPGVTLAELCTPRRPPSPRGQADSQPLLPVALPVHAYSTGTRVSPASSALGCGGGAGGLRVPGEGPVRSRRLP